MKTTFDIYLPGTKTRNAEFFKTITIEVEERYGEQFLTVASSQKIERIRYKEMKRRGMLTQTNKVHYSWNFKVLKWLAYKGWGRVSDWALAELKVMLAMAEWQDETFEWNKQRWEGVEVPSNDKLLDEKIKALSEANASRRNRK